MIVIGASMGGIEALTRLVAQLPADLPAALFVVQHISPESPGVLPAILDRAGSLQAIRAVDGEAIEHGRIYIAPPDQHLLVKPGHICLSSGPRENLSRPAIDPLFRSAAVAYGSRVIGVVLTGYLDDGTSGLQAIKRCGGTAVVQTPADAIMPSMPQSAIQNVEVDHVLPLAEMGELLIRLVQRPAGQSPPIPTDILWEVKAMEGVEDGIERQEELGKLVPLTCPDCGGALWEMYEGKLRRYRCHVGHAFTLRSMLAGQDEVVIESLWVALRSLEERIKILQTMARDEQQRGHSRSAVTYDVRAKELDKNAKQLRNYIETISTPILESDAGEV